MRIAVFTELYAPSVGGQEAFFRGLAAALIARGHQVDVHCIGSEQGSPSREVLNAVTVHRHPEDLGYKTPRIPQLKRNWGTIARYARHVRRIAKRDRYDFYLLNQWPLLHVPALPRAVRDRTLLHWCEIRRSGPFAFLQSRLPRLVRLNAAISGAVAREIATTSGRDVFTLPSGLDLSQARFRPRDQRSGIVVMGRVAKHKNLPLLVAAFERLRDGGYTGRLKIAGDGPFMPELRAIVAASPASAGIDLLGFIDEATKFDLMADSEVLAMPSMREGFPHAISEAMCCGLPVVTADYPENGTKDVVREFDVGVVTDTSVQSFADGIGQVLANWDRFSANGRRSAQSLDWAIIAEDLERRMLSPASS